MADPIKTGKKTFDNFLSEADPACMPNYDPRAKDPHAQAAGRVGGKKGGRARTTALCPKMRRKISKKAAKERWKKRIIRIP